MTVKDEAWFEEIYLTNKSAVMRYINSRIKNQQVVQDIFATTFEVAWKNRFKLDESILPYLIAVARNQIRKYWRELGRGEFHLSELIESSGTENIMDDVYVQRVADSALVSSILSNLSNMDSEILLLAYWDDLSTGAIAKVLGISETSARVRLHRARNRADKVLAKVEPGFREARIDLNRSKPKGVQNYEN
jgi:RNA polymerase sigma factor (sigma-70 family)